MHKIKKLFLQILQGKITYDNKIVPVVIKDYWADITPCITITGMTRDNGKYRRQNICVWNPLDPSHELYDEDDPDKEYPHSAQYTKKEYDIQLNLWCNNEKERELIMNQINDCIFYCMHDHHNFCINYNATTQKCSTTKSTCGALTDTGYRGLRKQCPAPIENNYCNYLNSAGVIRNSIEISPDYESDEYDSKPPLKRSIMEISLTYKDIRLLPSNPSLSAYVNF